MPAPDLDRDGFVPLAPGKLAALVTYLERDLADAPATPPPLPGNARAERLAGPDVDRYLKVFRAVGQDWLWFGRLRVGPLQLSAILADPAVEAYAIAGQQGDLGLLELDFRDRSNPEILYFGVVPAMVGKGLGGAMMTLALHRARAAGFNRLMLHTCSLDHPGALGFYCRAGFRPVKREVEVFLDPRLDGTLPRDAAPWMPLIDPAG